MLTITIVLMDFSSLNKQQKAAATHKKGHALVLAGAGSGKTTTLTYRVAWLLEEGVKPENICAMTFTNKAAKELSDRIVKQVNISLPFATTFHSFCAKILRMHGSKIGLKNSWRIADREDSINVLKKVLKEEGLKDVSASDILKNISKMKNNNKSFSDADSFISSLWKKYQEKLKESNCLDFDDLLVYANILLDGSSGDYWRKHFKHVLVDEYQDTNRIQESILEKLVGEKTCLWVVGDELQVLYSFRGAEVNRILTFENRWGKTKVYPIENNYRSTENILTAANSVVLNSKERTDKKLKATRNKGSKVELHRFYDADEEAEFVSETIKKLLEDYSVNDFAVLYRQHSQSRSVEHALRNLKIPYFVRSGIGFYSRMEVKHARSLLALAFNHDDVMAAERILLLQKGFGPASFKKLVDFRDEHEITIVQAMKQNNLSKKHSGFVASLGDLVDSFSENNSVSLLKGYQSLRDQINLLEWAKSSGEKSQERIENLSEFENSLALFNNGFKDDLESFLEMSSLEEGDMRENNEGVVLSTIHGAKGLEWPVVIIIGVEENFFIRDIKDTEEARRLIHVAITRAKDHAFLSYVQWRMLWGEIYEAYLLNIIKEIDSSSLTKYGIKQSNISSIPQQNNWLNYAKTL